MSPDDTNNHNQVSVFSSNWFKKYNKLHHFDTECQYWPSSLIKMLNRMITMFEY